MNVDAVVARVMRAVDDGSFSPSDVKSYINDGLEAVAGMLPLPSLEKTATVTTVLSQAYLTLPTDFYHHVRFVKSQTTRRHITMYPDLARMYECTPVAEAGTVRRATVVGNSLHYSPTPATVENLTIVYHAAPTRYATSTGPDYIPAHIGPALLEAYACKEIWDLIEDGIDGSPVNAQRWQAKFDKRLEDLRLYLGPFYNRPVREMETLDVMRL